MIHRTAASWQRNQEKDPSLFATDRDTVAKSPLPSWQQHLQEAITNPQELLALLALDPSYTEAAIAAGQLFPLKVPRTFIARIHKGDINDPLLKQILPIHDELQTPSGYSSDPVGEQSSQPTGIIHKYHGRVLLLVNGHCAVNCRYCFRRDFPYADNRLSRVQWEETLTNIQNDTSISEVIYSGGDPLASSDKQLLWLTEKIAAIKHVKRLRIHTRLPVVIPNRITTETLRWMGHKNLSTVVVLHINHANELKDEGLLSSIRAMKSAGVTLLNQTVLLKGVNDSVEALCTLSEALFESGVLPYYLHLLDKVTGSAHFDLHEQHAKSLHTQITAQLPGYLVPKLVREIADEPSKTVI